MMHCMESNLNDNGEIKCGFTNATEQINKIGHSLDLIHKLTFRALARIGFHAVYMYVHTNSGATALVDSWQFSAMNSVP